MLEGMGRPKKPLVHGTSGGYAKGCRCRPCTDAENSRQADMRAIRTAAPKDPRDKRHGTLNFYRNHGCRCVLCCDAQSDYYYANRK